MENINSKEFLPYKEVKIFDVKKHFGFTTDNMFFYNKYHKFKQGDIIHFEEIEVGPKGEYLSNTSPEFIVGFTISKNRLEKSRKGCSWNEEPNKYEVEMLIKKNVKLSTEKYEIYIKTISAYKDKDLYFAQQKKGFKHIVWKNGQFSELIEEEFFKTEEINPETRYVISEQEFYKEVHYSGIIIERELAHTFTCMDKKFNGWACSHFEIRDGVAYCRNYYNMKKFKANGESLEETVAEWEGGWRRSQEHN